MALQWLANGGAPDEVEPDLLPLDEEEYEDEIDFSSLSPEQDMMTARRAVSDLNKSTAATRAALQDARAKLLARKYDRTSALLAIATGLTRPTTTGGFSGFAESLGNMGAALQKPVGEKREFERQKIQDMLGVDQSMYGLDQQSAESAIKLAQIRARLTQLSKDPSAIQIDKYYQGLSPERRVQMLETMRNPNIQYKENEGVLTRLDPRAANHPNVPGIVGNVPETTLAAETAAQRTLAEARESGKTTGEKVATSQFNLPKALSGADYLQDLLTRLRDHKGMPYAVGATSVLPILPGTEAADFTAMLLQVGGKQFLEAYESLKGTGQITEIEGKQAKEALARMQKAQSEEAFREAADEFIEHVQRTVKILKTQARVPGSPGAPKRRVYDKTGKLQP